MSSMAEMIQNIIPVSLFNKGKAEKEYIALNDELNDLKLALEAKQRLENNNHSENLSEDEVCGEFGISEDDLKDWNDIDLE